MENVNKPFYLESETIQQLIVILVGLLVTLTGLPDTLAEQLQTSAAALVTAVTAFGAVVVMAYNYLAGKEQAKTMGFLPSFTNTAGLKTPEFYISVASSVTALIILLGFISSEQGAVLSEQVPAIVNALFALIGAFGVATPMARYQYGRGVIKAHVVANSR